MSLNGSGVYVVNSAGQPVVASTLITSAAFNAFTADIATALSTAIFKDGQATVTANIPFGGFKLTGVGAATARTDAATIATIQDATGVYSGTVGGTADAITLTPSPAITAYAAGQTFRFIASGANTTAVTVAISGLASPKAITKNGTTALVAGDIPSASIVTITYDGTRFILVTLSSTINTVTINTATINTSTVGADPTLALGIASRQYANSFRGALWGITLSNNGADATNDIDITSGEAMSNDTTSAARIVLTVPALTKRLDASWVTGTNQGMLSSSLTISNTTYHIFAMRVAGTDDIGADTSVTGANLTADHTATNLRRVGSIRRVGAVIVGFVQDGDYFVRKATITDVSSSNPGTSAVSQTLSVPTGINVFARIIVSIQQTTTAINPIVYISDLAVNDEVASGSRLNVPNVTNTATLTVQGAMLSVRTNTSSQIRSRLESSDANTTLSITTLGWTDKRGRTN